MHSFADKVIAFCHNLDFSGQLPAGISIMNPFRENGEVLEVISTFYRKYYSDTKPRRLILGISPLEHPRFIMQYKLKQKEFYIGNYIRKLRN